MRLDSSLRREILSFSVSKLETQNSISKRQGRFFTDLDRLILSFLNVESNTINADARPRHQIDDSILRSPQVDSLAARPTQASHAAPISTLRCSRYRSFDAGLTNAARGMPAGYARPAEIHTASSGRSGWYSVGRTLGAAAGRRRRSARRRQERHRVLYGKAAELRRPKSRGRSCRPAAGSESGSSESTGNQSTRTELAGAAVSGFRNRVSDADHRRGSGSRRRAVQYLLLRLSRSQRRRPGNDCQKRLQEAAFLS